MQLLVTKPAKKDLKKLPAKIYQKISEDVLSLAADPFPINSKKLRGGGNLYRIRIGDYRVIYQLNSAEGTIVVTRVKHRKDVYR